MSVTVLFQIMIVWSATGSFSTHRITQNFSRYSAVTDPRMYSACPAGASFNSLNIPLSTFLTGQSAATTAEWRAPLTKCRPHDPISASGGYSFSSRFFWMTSSTFQLTLGPSIAVRINFSSGRSAIPVKFSDSLITVHLEFKSIVLCYCSASFVAPIPYLQIHLLLFHLSVQGLIVRNTVKRRFIYYFSKIFFQPGCNTILNNISTFSLWKCKITCNLTVWKHGFQVSPKS